VGKQEYLRLIDLIAKKYGSNEAEACKNWADVEAEALISYKGKSREEYTEQLKHAQGALGEGQRVYLGGFPRQEPQKKGMFRGFKKPKEESEFVSD